MAVYEKGQQGQQVDRPEAFLMRTALNLSVDMHRESVREGEVVALTDDLVVIDTAPSVEATVLARERAQRLQVCLARLGDRTREILVAYRVEGLTYKEIGRHYGVSKSTVEWHVSRGVELITEWMEEW